MLLHANTFVKITPRFGIKPLGVIKHAPICNADVFNMMWWCQICVLLSFNHGVWAFHSWKSAIKGYTLLGKSQNVTHYLDRVICTQMSHQYTNDI